jgi:N-acetylmuramoyl-L-alanine amidase
MFDLSSKPWLVICGLAAIYAASSSPAAYANSVETSPVPGKLALAQSVPQTAKQKDQRPLVTIDPGHGGKDSGAIGLNGLREVDVILPIALRVAKILNEKGVATQLTRDSDYFVGLDQRVIMSRNAGASIFVSIHANSIDNRPDVNGLETYYYGKGLELADTVHRSVLERMDSNRRSQMLNDRGTRSARFLVLRKSEIPAILVEVGYLTSPDESLLLADQQYRDQMADAIAYGILRYLGKETGTSGTIKPTNSNNTVPQRHAGSATPSKNDNSTFNTQ